MRHILIWSINSIITNNMYLSEYSSQKDIANMKNEIEKRQREDDNNAKANQSSQQSLEEAQNGTDDDTTEVGEPVLANGVESSSAPAKVVAC